MDQHHDSLQQRAAGELRTVIAAGEELLHHSAEQAGAEYGRARARFESMLADAKQGIANAEAAALRQARLAGAKTDLYVQTHPWQSLGYGAAAAAAIGLLAGLLIGRR